MPTGRTPHAARAFGREDSELDPVSLAFSGIRVRSALRSLPKFYRAEDAEWEDTARQLIARADRIVFDASDGSSSITLEGPQHQRAPQHDGLVPDAADPGHVVEAVPHA